MIYLNEKKIAVIGIDHGYGNIPICEAVLGVFHERGGIQIEEK